MAGRSPRLFEDHHSITGSFRCRMRTTKTSNLGVGICPFPLLRICVEDQIVDKGLAGIRLVDLRKVFGRRTNIGVKDSLPHGRWSWSWGDRVWYRQIHPARRWHRNNPGEAAIINHHPHPHSIVVSASQRGPTSSSQNVVSIVPEIPVRPTGRPDAESTNPRRSDSASR
jgi:hypothetical protein